MGAPFRQPEWSALALIEAPDFVRRAHQGYVDAGADVLTTNSYAVVPFHIGAQRFAQRGEALADLAGRLARAVADAAGRPVSVAASLPPVCGSYRADLFRPEDARPVLETLIRGLRPHAHLWLAETLSLIEEAELVRELLGADPRPLWLSFTLRDDGALAGDPRLRSGQTVAQRERQPVRLDAAAVLFNCSQPEVMGDALEAAVRAVRGSAHPTLRIGVYANAFAPQTASAEANSGLDDIRQDLTPAGYLGWARQWRALGADIIGGCCGIGPEHIAALRTALRD